MAVPVKASTSQTDVKVTALLATRQADGVLVTWRDGYQPDALGFYVHRSDARGDRVRLNALRYQAGEATMLELVDTQNALNQARNAYDDGLVRYRLALANLQTLTGTF